MSITFASIDEALAHGFDEVIDVRSPAEYAEDHMPGAINLPVLDDAERARVGTMFKQVSPFDARKLGAALVAQNAARHLMGPLADRPGGWRPLVYCWRGGQRSGSFASILGQIGWRAEVVSGGYKAWRRLVVDRVYDAAFPSDVVVLDGNTGSAKTEVLNLLPGRGVQVIDLEGLANHRGSLFGSMGPQPGQKAFEARLAIEIAALDPERPVVIEAESSKVGACIVPPRLWRAMVAAPRVVIAAPVMARADYLSRAYADLTADRARLNKVIGLLSPSHSAEVIAEWHALALAEDYTRLSSSLMARHYDPRYARHRSRMEVRFTECETPDLSAASVQKLADRIAALVHAGAAQD